MIHLINILLINKTNLDFTSKLIIWLYFASISNIITTLSGYFITLVCQYWTNELKKTIQWNSMNISGLSFSYWKKNPGGPNIFKYKETSNLAKMIWKLVILQREFHTFLNRWFSLTISGWIPITCRLKTEKTSTAFKLTWSVYTLHTLYISLENVF